MPRRLYRVGMENDALPAAERADFGNGLDGADLVVGKHHGHAAGIVPDGGGNILHAHDAVAVHVQQRHRKALLLQLPERMQDSVMLKGGGDQVLFPLARSGAGAGSERLVVALAAAGGEIDLLRTCGAQAHRHRAARLFQALKNPPPGCRFAARCPKA